MLILPRVRAARSPSYSPRIINVSSAGHRFAGVRFDDLSFGHGSKYEVFPAYAQAKTANILFTKEFSKRYKGEGILAYAVHPGCKYGAIPHPDSFAQYAIIAIWTNLANSTPLDVMIDIGEHLLVRRNWWLATDDLLRCNERGG
jgi:NAD(P)-dependent dehydrogenase (short-subunit alcohol dehydrogenase family)